MNVTELFANVRKVVQTGLVVDIPWLPDFQMFAGEVYFKPKDYDDKYVAVRNVHVKYALSSIEKGNAELPGEGSVLEKTVRTMNGLEQCKDLSVLHSIGEGLKFWERKTPDSYLVKASSQNVGLEFTSPERVAEAARSIVESIPVDAYAQGLAKDILKKGSLYYLHRSRFNGAKYYELVDKDVKATLERIIETPENLRMTDEALGRMKDVAEGKYGLPLSEVKNLR